MPKSKREKRTIKVGARDLYQLAYGHSNTLVYSAYDHVIVIERSGEPLPKLEDVVVKAIRASEFDGRRKGYAEGQRDERSRQGMKPGDGDMGG